MRMLAAAIVVLAGSQVTADTLETSRNQPITETAHIVTVTFDHGVATVVVQRTFANAGRTADQIGLEFALPDGAAATNLRIRARQRWYTGELLDAKVASERYRALTGYGAHEVKDPALLSWVERGKLLLQLFPVMPGSTATVEYTLTAPMAYADGRYTLDYPSSARGSLVTPRVTADGATIEDGPDIERISIPGPATTTSSYGRVVASPAHSIGRLDLDLASRLSTPPVRAQVVFAIDASHSIGDRLGTELDIIRAYASELPDAEIEIVAYRRIATPIFGGFVPARELPSRLATAISRGAFALGNGSRIDDALRVASRVLAKRSGAKRVVVMTDELIPPSLVPWQAETSLEVTPDTVVHVVVPGRGDLVRDDAPALARIASAHHGIFMRGSGVRGLIRPISIDKLMSIEVDIAESSRPEGSRLEVISHAKTLPENIHVIGHVWSDIVVIEAIASPAASRNAAAFAIGGDDLGELSDDEKKTVALAAHAVSPVTSYLAIEPGVRPSRRGFERGVEGGVEGGVVTGDSGCAAPPPPPPPQRPNPATVIDARACHATHDVRLAIDTTRDEIVDVTIAGTRDAITDCVVEAAWRARLDKRFYTADRDHYDVAVRR